MERASGVLLPLFSLPGPFCLGTLGATARRFIDLISAAGFTYWQMLPLCPPDGFLSPYAARSSFAWDIAYLDPYEMQAEGLLTADEVADAVRAPGRWREADAADRRYCLLTLAAPRADRTAVEDFLRENPDTATYCRLASEREGRDFFALALGQYELWREWCALREYAHARGVRLIGDLPIYVAADSYDALACPEAFLTDGDGHPVRVAGVPPDYFAPEGQVWGNPLYDYARLAEDGFAFLRRRFDFIARRFDAVRLDHFRGYDAYFSVPVGKGAREGSWEAAPGDAVLSALRTGREDYPMIAEDLGEVGEGVERLRRAHGLLSTRVLQFGFLGDPQSVHLPYRYPVDSAVYSGTHDNETLQEYIARMPDGERAYLLDYCGAQGGEAPYRAVVRTLLSSSAALAVFPLADLLGLGAPFRINTPGRAEGNWSVRFSDEEIATLDCEHYRYMNRLFGR